MYSDLAAFRLFTLPAGNTVLLFTLAELQRRAPAEARGLALGAEIARRLGWSADVDGERVGEVDGHQVQLSWSRPLSPPFGAPHVLTAMLQGVAITAATVAGFVGTHLPPHPAYGDIVVLVALVSLVLGAPVGAVWLLVPASARRARASVVRVQASTPVEGAGRVAIRRRPAGHGIGTGDPDFDDAHTCTGDRATLQALLGAEARAHLSATPLELQDGRLTTLLPDDPDAAVRRIHDLVAAAEALAARTSTPERLLQRLREETSEGPRVAALDALLWLECPERDVAIADVLATVGIDATQEDAPDAAAAWLTAVAHERPRISAVDGAAPSDAEPRPTPVIAAIALIGLRGLSPHLPALQALIETHPTRSRAAISQVRARVGDARAGGLDLAEKGRLGALSVARRGGELSRP